jgi:hypothetical protein
MWSADAVPSLGDLLLSAQCRACVTFTVSSLSVGIASIVSGYSGKGQQSWVPGYQAEMHSTSQHARMGSNLGLPICFKLAAAMKASVGITEVGGFLNGYFPETSCRFASCHRRVCLFWNAFSA